MWRRGNWQAGFGERFARYGSKFKQAITNRDVIWFHAVSVGEVNICTQLIKALEPRAPDLCRWLWKTRSPAWVEGFFGCRLFGSRDLRATKLTRIFHSWAKKLAKSPV